MWDAALMCDGSKLYRAFFVSLGFANTSLCCKPEELHFVTLFRAHATGRKRGLIRECYRFDYEAIETAC